METDEVTQIALPRFKSPSAWGSEDVEWALWNEVGPELRYKHCFSLCVSFSLAGSRSLCVSHPSSLAVLPHSSTLLPSFMETLSEPRSRGSDVSEVSAGQRWEGWGPRGSGEAGPSTAD